MRLEFSGRLSVAVGLGRIQGKPSGRAITIPPGWQPGGTGQLPVPPIQE